MAMPLLCVTPGEYDRLITIFDDEIAVVTSERPVIQTVLNVPTNQVHELKPGHAVIIKKDNSVKVTQVREEGQKKSCSFERIYFSRGSDSSIYKERKKLGELLSDQIMSAVDNDFNNTVFSFIPNTAETAFYGMLHGVEINLKPLKKKKFWP
jgi:amidophosphoribosyltransferase